MSDKLKVALVQANTGSCYLLAKILFKMGIQVDVIHHEDHIIRHSRYIHRFHIVGSPFDNFQKGCEDIQTLNHKEKYNLIVPINDVALEICCEIKKSINEVLYDNNKEADSYRDKLKLWSIAKTLNIPTIEGEIIHSLDEYEAKRIQYQLPLVLKTKKSVDIIRNRIHKFSVKKCTNIQQMDNFVTDHINNSPILIQQAIAGFGVGFNFFSINGELVSYYAHQRLTEQNDGGVSSFRKTINPNEFNLLQLSKKLIKTMNWNGIGMLEYRVNNNQAYIIELNGRPWGSMALGELSGCNPITDYIQKKLHNQLPDSNQLSRINIHCCKIKEDIKNKIQQANNHKLSGIVKWIISLPKFVRPGFYVEDINLSDPIYTYKYWIPKLKRKPIFAKVKTIQTISVSDKICFVCYGNINRSPFAEAVFKKQFPHTECISTGLINISNRNVSRQALSAAKKYSVDLHNHKSSFIKEHDLTDWKLIAMDEQNVQTAVMMGFNSDQIFKLGNSNIVDPHLCSDWAFEKVYKEITDLITNLKH